MPDKSMRTAIWKGLNRMPYIGDGEMRDMKNLSSDAYPFITTRKGRAPYTFDIYIPSPEGEAYRDIERLPEPCADEDGNTYKLTESYAEDEYISGEFYYYDAANAKWVQGIKDSTFLGIANSTIAVGNTQTMMSNKYYDSFSGDNCLWYANYQGNEQNLKNIRCTITHPAGTCSYYITRDRIRYTGEDNGLFKKGKCYAYKVYAEAYLGGASGSIKYDREYLFAPDANNAYYSYVYRYYNTEQTTGSITYSYIEPTGETRTETFTIAHGNRFKVYLRGYGYWEEIEADEYETVYSMPENLADGKQIFFIGDYYGAPVEKTYYVCKSTVNNAGEVIYFYAKAASVASCTYVTFLPEATEDNYGKTYYYSGIQKGGFATCELNGGVYKWVSTTHPRVKRTVTVEEYLTKYREIDIAEILEIAAFEGQLAVLFTTKTAEIKLLYKENLYNVNNVTLEEGKKLSIAGSKLIIGESGAYIHIKDNATNFFKAGSAFTQTIWASYAEYGNGGVKAKYSNLRGDASTGSATFNIWTGGASNAGFKAVADGLAVAGTNFSVTFNGNTYYLTSQSATYEVRDFEWGVGSSVYHDYGVLLQITATGAKENFEWDNYDNGFGLQITFASTDPHFYDVVTWKKRLWGYEKNVLRGTVSDIFSANGTVDWVTGDNTYTEAISQPLWQGGNITGIAALMNGLLCFKEDSLTIVTGNYPAVMSSNTIPCRGLPPENRRSVAVANECVYYLSTDGVYRYGGGIPQCISRDVKIKGTHAVGASDGNKYWLSVKEEGDKYALYVFDINRQTWHREDDTNSASFTMLNGEMYMAVGTEILNINAPQDSNADWMCELWYDEGTHRKKKYKEFYIRGNVGECEMFLKADEGEWKLVKSVEGKLQIRIPPMECEELGILLRGKGICEIKSLDRVFEVE